MPSTRIRKNSKERTAALENATDIKVYSVNNGFIGKDISSGPLQGFDVEYADLYRTEDGSYQLRVHSNLWYEFRKG